MTAPLRILLADDQVPWDRDEENQRTKAEIRREFAVEKPHVNVDVAFEYDYRWFTGLLRYLEQKKGATVIRARTFEEARQHLENPRDLDVAIVDLSWWGDSTLGAGASERENRGLKLLPEAVDANRPKIPIVSLSQNFRHDFELMGDVLELGALPVPKPDSGNSQDRELSYRALYAAVRYITKNQRSGSSKIELFISHAHGDRELAKQLVRAIDVGLHVPPDAIRCTSVPGYAFQPGTDFAQALRAELTGARCVVGLWTPISAKSQWCVFELGAAWGLTHKTLFLSLGGETLRDPPAGFRTIQVSRVTDAGELRSFLEELARITGWRIKNRPAAESELEELAKLARDCSESQTMSQLQAPSERVQ